jgi:uncharacterized membrane protein
MLLSDRSPWLILLGFALGGFFDGILLHQILQWHHLLSALSSRMTLQAQILWDGYFHALMYVLALVALWRIWRSGAGSAWNAGNTLPQLLVGFGMWHVVDTLLSHWILGIHRIRVDSPRPLVWDLLWLVVFGLIPLVAGWVWRRRSMRRRGAGDGPSNIVPLLTLAGFTIGAGVWAMQPPGDGDALTTVVFAPGVAAADVIAAIRSADARVAWASQDMRVVVIDVTPERRPRLYLRGAMLVGGSGLPAGCASWTQA